MKLSYALLAIAAATETTTNAIVETTAPGTTAASITEASTAAAVSTAAAASTAAATTTDSVETTVAETTVAVDDAVAAAALEACKKAQEDLAATTNSLEKVSLTAACQLVCDSVEGESCGFLVNGLSFVVFGILALFKY